MMEGAPFIDTGSWTDWWIDVLRAPDFCSLGPIARNEVATNQVR